VTSQNSISPGHDAPLRGKLARQRCKPRTASQRAGIANAAAQPGTSEVRTRSSDMPHHPPHRCLAASVLSQRATVAARRRFRHEAVR
jgi:hypothetical protein